MLKADFLLNMQTEKPPDLQKYTIGHMIFTLKNRRKEVWFWKGGIALCILFLLSYKIRAQYTQQTSEDSEQ